MNNFNNNYYFDFSESAAMGGQTNGHFSVDTEMSDLSMNPIANSIVKKYIDDGRGAVKLIFVKAEGRESYYTPLVLAGYDFVICYASSSPENTPTCFCVPIRYLADTEINRMSIQLSDSENYTNFTFSKGGFFTDTFSGESGGKIYAMYGVKI